jgi:hypothetical protein
MVMIRTILASAAALSVTAGAAGAQTVIYDDGYVTYGAPVIVERRAAVIPAPPVFVAPADRYVIFDHFDQLSPGAPTGQDATDNKRTVGDARRDARDMFYRSRPVIIYR